VGAKGIRRRKPWRPLPKLHGDIDPSLAPWELQHSPYTIEGEIEGLRRFSWAATHRRSRHRRAAQLFVVFYMAVVLGLAFAVLTAVVALVRALS
jgi:hypothetical protein